MHSIDPPPDLTPLWTRVRTVFARAADALGGAASIAAHTALAPKLRREIVGWIALLEHLVRKLLFAEAARVAPPPAGWTAGLEARTAPPAAIAQTSARRAPDLSAPETWSARFSFAPPRDPRAVPEALAPRIRDLWSTQEPPPPPPRTIPRTPSEDEKPFLLARRFEALRRVLENPAPYAHRLARIMRRLVRRFPEAIMRFVFAPARTNNYDRRDPLLGVDCSGAAFVAVPAMDTS